MLQAPSKAAKQKKASPAKRFFCCISPCVKPDSKVSGEPASEAPLLD